MPFQTVIYNSAQAGMPATTLTAAGGLTALLDAVLVDGMNVRNTGMSITRSGSTATLAFSGTNNFAIGEVVEVAGWDQAEYNGRFKVTAKAAGSVSFTVSGTPTSPGTGATPSIKHPAAGWTRAALGTNIVGYQAGAGSLGHWMQVEDNNPYADANVGARTRLAEGLTALDTAVSLGDQRRIQKVAGTWVVVADRKTCYVIMGASNVFMFGEFSSFNPTDNYAVFQTRGETGETNSVAWAGAVVVSGRLFPQPVVPPGSNATYAAPGVSYLRGNSQLSGFVNGHCLEASGYAISTGDAGNRRYQGLTAPNAADNSIPLMPLFAVEIAATQVLRGQFRGMYWPLATLATDQFVGNVARLDDIVIGGAVRSVALARFGLSSGAQIAFDLGDWA